MRMALSEDVSYYARVQRAVLTFIQDHPGSTLDRIITGLSFEPSDTTTAILELEEKAKIKSHSDKVDYSSTLTTYYPA